MRAPAPLGGALDGGGRACARALLVGPGDAHGVWKRSGVVLPGPLCMRDGVLMRSGICKRTTIRRVACSVDQGVSRARPEVLGTGCPDFRSGVGANGPDFDDNSQQGLHFPMLRPPSRFLGFLGSCGDVRILTGVWLLLRGAALCKEPNPIRSTSTAAIWAMFRGLPPERARKMEMAPYGSWVADRKRTWWSVVRRVRRTFQGRGATASMHCAAGASPAQPHLLGRIGFRERR